MTEITINDYTAENSLVYYSKLGPGPYYYDNSAVAAALREAVEGLKLRIDQKKNFLLKSIISFGDKTG